MKKRLLMALLPVTALLFSCKATREESVEDNAFTLIALQDLGDDTKTVISGTQSVFWETAEEIKVFKADKSGHLFKSTNTEASASAVFTGDLTYQDVAEGEELWAVYPFSKDAVFDGETITTELPTTQVARPESFARDMNLSVARTTSRRLQFRNVGGGVRFSVTQDGVSKVIFEGLNGEIISGKVKIGFEGNVPVVKEVTGGSQFITLLPPEGQTFQKDKWYYIVAIPGALTKGYKLRFYKGDDYARKVSETPVTIKRGIYGSVARADAAIEYESVTTHFPETKEEWEESYTVTESVASSWDTILGDEIDFSDMQAIIDEVEQVENVSSVEQEGSCLVITQKDGIKLFVMLESYGYVPDDEEEDSGQEPFSSPLWNKSYAPNNQERIYEPDGYRMPVDNNENKKALILLPFYSAWLGTEPIDSYKSDLMAVGFKEGNIKILKNDEANHEAFYGSFLSQFDVVIIHTHGNYSSSNGTILTTGTVYEEELLDTYLLNAPVEYFVLAKQENFIGTKTIKYIAANAALMATDVSFPGSWIHLSACRSMMFCDLADALIDAHAEFVSGYKRSVYGPTEAEPTTKNLLSYLSYGFSAEQAYNLVNKKYLLPRGNRNYYLSDPTPFQLKSVVDKYNVKLTWNQRPTKGYYEFEVYVRGNRVKTTTDKSFEIYCDIAGKSEWYVVANLYIDGALSASFTSDKEEFIIEETTPTEPQIAVNPASITFNNTIVGRQAEQTVTISNSGNAALTISSVTCPAGYDTDFNQWESKVIAANGGEHQLKIFFKPSSTKSFSGNVVITSDATNQPTLSVPVFGTGISASEGDYPIPEAIDLGLSVKWASWNVGASAPEEFGYYFAWGETEPKPGYNWDNYKWCLDGYSNKITKYNSQNEYGIVDDRIYLEPEDDAASAHYGGNWRMPTHLEQEELIENCDETLESGYHRYTSKINGNSIIIPRAGRYQQYDQFVNYTWDYWSSTVYRSSPNKAYYMGNASKPSGGEMRRDYGLAIRAVYSDPVPAESIFLDKTELIISAGNTSRLATLIYPSNATDRRVCWTSSNANVARVYDDGKVEGISEGIADITVTALNCGETASCHVTVAAHVPSVPVPEAVDLGLSVKWASFNIGASAPEEFGDYYAWGEVVAKEDYTIETYKWCDGSETSFTKYCDNSSYGIIDYRFILEPDDDVAHAKLGGGWRTPTKDELIELRDNCDWNWTARDGVNGYELVSRKNGATLFLPAAGNRRGNSLNQVNTEGVYWSASMQNTSGVWLLVTVSSQVNVNLFNRRYYGLVIRPVRD